VYNRRAAIVGRAVVRRQDQRDLRANAAAEETEELHNEEGRAKAFSLAGRDGDTFSHAHADPVTEGKSFAESVRVAEGERQPDTAAIGDTDSHRVAVSITLFEIEQEKEEGFTDSQSDGERKLSAGREPEPFT
jgi:hypothetical protein